MNSTDEKISSKIITIPNVISFFRLILIPLIIYVYYVKDNNTLAFILLFVSGASDILDGIIARKFNMISSFGKIIDPVADKLTQFFILFILCFNYKRMIILTSLLAAKELASGIVGCFMIKKTDDVISAEWHGKATTVSIYSTMLLHLIYSDMSIYLSYGLIIFCAVLMIISFIMYMCRYRKNYKKLVNDGIKKD